jgi:hypothetical protein
MKPRRKYGVEPSIGFSTHPKQIPFQGRSLSGSFSWWALVRARLTSGLCRMRSTSAKLQLLASVLLLTGHGGILVYGSRVIQESNYVWTMLVVILVMDVMLFTRACRPETARDWWYVNRNSLIACEHESCVCMQSKHSSRRIPTV